MRKPPLVFRHFADGDENVNVKNVARLVEALAKATAAKRDLIVLVNSRGGTIEEFLKIEPIINTHKSRGLIFATAIYLDAYSTGLNLAVSGNFGYRVAIPEAKFQLHQASEVVRDMELKVEDYKAAARDLDGTNRRLCKHLGRYTAITGDFWYKIIRDLPGADDDFLFTAADALHMGVIDEISEAPLETLITRIQNRE